MYEHILRIPRKRDAPVRLFRVFFFFFVSHPLKDRLITVSSPSSTERDRHYTRSGHTGHESNRMFLFFHHNPTRSTRNRRRPGHFPL